jgi:hypothetical protein
VGLDCGHGAVEKSRPERRPMLDLFLTTRRVPAGELAVVLASGQVGLTSEKRR